MLATFVLAALSAGYAMYSVFNNGALGGLFAVVWGLIIFNFDRFLVSTMRKYGVSRQQTDMDRRPAYGSRLAHRLYHRQAAGTEDL